MISSRQWFRFLLIFTGSLSLFLAALSSQAFAKIEQWDFQNKDQYQFDSQKIQIKEKGAQLVASDPYRDQSRENFDKGNYELNTTSLRNVVELTAQNIYETAAPEIAAPISNFQTGLAALWHFDEPSGTNVLDEASRTVAKTSDTEIVSSQTGFGFSRSFDGEKSYVFVPNYETFKFDRAITLEAWIRPQVTVGAKPQTIISRWQQAGAQKSFAFQISSEGKLDFVLSPDGAISKHYTGDTILSPGIWYHVAAVFNGENVRVYLNGVLDAAPVVYGEQMHPSSNPIYIGSLINNKLDEFYKGGIDEVAFYTRALTETELLNHAGNSRAMVGLWHLNERSGPLADASGFGQHAMPVQKPNYEVEGKLGNAVHFDGKKQYLETPATSRFAADGSLTLEAWVKPEKISGPGEAATIISSVPDLQNPGMSAQGEYSLAISGPGGTLKAIGSGMNPAEIVGKTTLMPNVWQHVAVTWADGRANLYLNGTLDASITYKGILHSGKSGIRIGMDSKTLAPFPGAIDEVSIYRRARTSLEISSDAGGINPAGIYTSAVKDALSDSVWRVFSWKEPIGYGKGLSNEEVGLLHLYHLDEKEQNTFVDAKGEIEANAVGTYPVGGMFSQARWFKTKGLDKIISQKNFPSLSTFTLSFWFEFANSTPGLSDRLFSIGDANLTAFRTEDGHVHVTMLGAREIVSQTVVQDTRWHHLAVTADGRNLFLYIDGVLEGNSPFMSATAEAPLVLGNLKSLDTFQGVIDEVAFFNAPLSRETLFEHYLRGKLSLIFQVRSSNESNLQDVAWHDLNSNVHTGLQAEASTVGLWHFNDPKYFGKANEVTDGSRFSNHGVAYGRVSSTPFAISGSAISLNGASDSILIPDSESLHLNIFTLSAWIKPHQIQEDDAVILDKSYEGGAPAFSSYALELVSGNRLNVRLGYGRGYMQVQTDLAGEIVAGKWNHVAATYNGKEVRLYINGELRKIAPFQESVLYDKGPLYLGRYGASASRFFEGEIDEIRIESKALEVEDIAHLYEAERLHNIPVTEGKLDIDRGRYFQYRALLGSESANATPQFQQVEVRANLFSTDRPSISNLKGVSYADISHFGEKLGAGNRGAVSYQLSNDGANWFYHNGRRWVIASGFSESNTADQIQMRVHDFAKEVGIGSFYFKAFLHSPTGLEPAELEKVDVEYLPNKLTVTSPNGGEGWIVGSEHAISWNSMGELQKVTLEYSKDDFKSDFHQIAKNQPNTGSYTWKIPDDLATQVKVRVIDGLDPRVYDISDLSFRIAGALEVVSPNWNERWEVGSTHDVTWKTTGSIKDVKLDFSTDEFLKAIYPIVDSVKNENKFSWKVTDPISSNVRIRVMDVRDPLTFDKSNDTFAIHGKIAIQSPDAKSRWIVGSDQEIRWENTGTIAAVKVEYQGAKKDEWIVIADKVSNQKSIKWKVPDDIDTKAQVRITDITDSKVNATSPDFAIVGGLRLTNPAGGENWTIGSRRKIAWQTVGNIPAVNLEYKLSSKDEWLPIANSVANTGSYVWDIPEQPADLVAVRITAANEPSIQADSVLPSRIIPAFVLKSPNGGESLKIGAETEIAWETKGKVDKVKLEYSKDNFEKDIHTIISEASNIGRFSWTVADDPSAKVKIRVSASDLPSSHDISDSDLRIYPSFQFSAPQGGEKYEVGSLATLTWKTIGTVPNVRLEYSHDDFTKDDRIIANSIPDSGRYTWTVPDDIGAGYSIRISDVRDSKAQDFSQGFFAIIGNFRILEPMGGEGYTAGTITPVKWKGSGSVPFVRIDYSEDGFEKTFQTIAEQAPNTGKYDWLVPNLIGHEFRLRVWDPSHPDAQDIMAKPARIIGGFRLLAPNGGEVIYVGDEVDVQWEVLGTIPNVKIEYSDDHFQKNIGEIADAYENTGTYHWQVPDLPTGSYTIRVSDPRDATAFDLSNSDFKVRSRFTVISPNGGEGWAVGDKKIITWQTTGSVPSVNLEYSIDDFASVKTIAEKAPNTGTYEWTIPDQVSQNVRVRVSDVKDFEAFDISDGGFRIQGVLTLDSPVAGDLLRVGEQRVIHWKTAGRVEGVRLEYSHDNFASEVKTIVDTIPNTGSYNWTVPDDISPNTKIRVLDLKDLRTQSISSDPFQIAAAFRIMGPNGGERWHASEKREVTWATLGTVKEVNLEYSKDDFKTDPQTIDRGVLNTGKFTWELPRDMGLNFKLRVCDADNPKVCDASDREFSVEAPFEFTYPKGGERWPVGSNQELRWNVYGYVPRVIVQYAVQEPPVEWKTLIAELPNEGHLLFKVPDDISKTVRFRVADFEDGDVAAVTEKPIEIIGTFQLLTPNGGEKWLATSTQKITWKTLGTAPLVRLEYSDDDFKRNVKIIESSYKNTGTYDWTIPGDLSPALKVRIKDVNNDASFDISDEPFKILPHFTVLTPNGGEHWVSGDKVQIQWKTEGSVPRARLEYGTREENTAAYSWQPIANVRGVLQNYDWTVPANVSSDVKIRVFDERDLETIDESDQPFKMLARFKATTPRMDEVLTVDSRYAIKWETVGRVPSVKLEYALVPEKQDASKPLEFKAIENFWSNSGLYYWTVPDAAGEKLVVRVSDAREADAFVLSDAFKIRGALKFDLPEGELHWAVGSQQTLRWKTIGTISNVKLEYSTDGKIWKLIEESIPNSGSYGWLVPDDLSQTVRLRILNVQNSAVFSELDRPVNIMGEFHFVGPVAGDKLTVGSKQKISWKTTGSVKRVWLDYSVGKNWITIAGPINNEGTYEWTIPDAISAAAQLRIKDPDNPTSIALSDVFNIQGHLDLVVPMGGEVWEVASTQAIQWKTTGSIPFVRIEGYWEDLTSHSDQTQPAAGVVGPQLPVTPTAPSESSWFIISENETNRGRYEWTIPDKIGDQLKIRVSDTRDLSISQTSPKPFSIIGTLRVLNPKGAESWTVGAQQQIVWSSQGRIPNVLLEYTRDDFYRDVNVIASEVPNTGAALWTVPDSISDQVKIRVSDSRDKRAYHVSPAFRIQGALEFITPHSEEILKVAAKEILHWKTTGSIPLVRLEYSRDDFHRDIQVIENNLVNKDTYEWQIPDIVSTTVKLRVMDLHDKTVFAVTAPFKVEGSLQLKAPAGKEKLQALSVQKIIWDTVGTIPKVRLEYSRDDFAQDIHLISGDVTNQGTYDWIVPDDIGPGVKVRILNAGNFSVSSVSPEAFSIHGAFSFTLASESRRWPVATPQEINWQTVGTIPQIKLEYSKDDFQNDIHLIAEGVTNENRYKWLIPDDIAENVRLRISDVRDREVFAVTSLPISTIGQLKLSEPTKDSVFKVFEEALIKWNSVGTIPGIRLEYQTMNQDEALKSDAWKIIVGLTENMGQYLWKVPNDIAFKARIRISDGRDPLVQDLSAEFPIIGKVSVITPAGGERWIVGTPHEILWQSTGTLPEVTLQYSIDGFVKDVRKIAEKVPNSGRMIWTAPDTITDKIQVKVSDPRMPERVSYASAPLSIIGDFVIASPNAPVTWKVGNEVRLEWQTVGTIPQVRIEYLTSGSTSQSETLFAQFIQTLARGVDSHALGSRNVGIHETHILQDKVPNQGIYRFHVPDWIGEGGVLRISDARDISVAQVSPPIKIEGTLQFLIPQKEEIWTVGETKLITWQKTGTIPFVELEYSTDDFQRDIHSFSDFEKNANQVQWHVPDSIGTIRLRLRDSRDEKVAAVSEKIQIQGALQMIRPQGREIMTVGSAQEIVWKTTGTIPQVRLEYSTDGFDQDVRIIEVKAETSSLLTKDKIYSYLWKVPDSISEKAQVRVTDIRENRVTAVSEPFKIKGAVQMMAPQGGERWIVGESHVLLWQSTGTLPEVTLQYSADGFVKDIRTILEKMPNEGRMIWVVPDSISDKIQVRVQDPRMADVVSSTSQPISIAGDLVITGPNAPVTWKVGDEVQMEWQTVGTIPQVKIEYLTPGSTPHEDSQSVLPTSMRTHDYHILQDKVPNQGIYRFHVPDWIGEGGLLRLSDTRDANVMKLSPAIKIKGDLKFVSPQPGEIWKVGEDKLLEWKTTGTIPSVTLEYSTDNFQRDIRLLQNLSKNENRFLWNVPDSVGPVRVRVRDNRDEKVSSVSEEAQVRSVIQVLHPQTRDILTVGSGWEIVWKTTGSIPQVRLEYSTDHFEQDVRIIEVKTETSRLLTPDGIYSYLWEVPDSISDEIQVRVTDIRDSRAAASSEPFKIKGAFEMTAPQGGEIWKVGAKHELSWGTTGAIPFVRLEYSRDGFNKDIQVIVAKLENKGSYSWNVADTVGQQVWVRVVDEHDPSVFAGHSKPFEVEGILQLEKPLGGEIWKVNDSVPVSWVTTGTIPEVKLTYTATHSDAQSESPVTITIADHIPNQSRYIWQIPENIPPQIQMELSDSANPRVFSQTKTAVKILGTLKVTSPSALVQWPIGSIQTLTWESRGPIPQVKVEGSRDGFEKEILLLFPLLPNTGSAQWKVQDLISKNFQIRISDIQNPDVFSISSAPIEIMGGFNILAPAPAGTLEVGAKEEVVWQTTGTIPEVRLEYSSDHFNHATVIAEKIPNTGRFQWQVPDSIGDHFEIRVLDLQHPEMNAVSERPFRIQGRLALKSPQGGEIWKVGSDVPLSWDSIGSIPRVTLEYSTDDFSKSIPVVEDIPNQGNYTWHIPDVVSEKVKLRVRDAKNPEVFSVTLQPLKIQGALVLMAPQGGEFWETNTQHAIIWRTVGSVPFVTIEYSINNFATAIPVILGVANEGRYQWTAPDLNAETFKFRILDAHDSSVFSVSDAIEVGGTLSLLSPQGGEVWTVNENATIQWKTGGTIPRIKIELSSDDFSKDVRTIDDAAVNNGNYTWKVSDQIAANYKVRIRDASNLRISDKSKGVFKIAGSFVITSPEGGEHWPVGSSQAIQWQSRGTIPTVRLEYSKDNFRSTVPISTNVKNTGRFSWDVPDLAGEQVQFRISDALDPTVGVSMLKPVAVDPVLTLLTPRGGEVWKSQDSQSITWRTVGTLSYVNLQYSTDDFQETKEMAASIANTGSFLWTVPDLSTKNLKVRVVDAISTHVMSENRVPVQVVGQIEITNPMGGDVWMVGAAHPINWASKGDIPFVRIEYSNDGFRTVFPIAVHVANEGHYDWTVPDAISKESRIRVVNDSDPSIVGQMGKSFEIRGALNLLTPVGGEYWTIGSRHPISWQNTGTIPQVRLEYSADDFVNDIHTITPTLDNKGVYYWEIPSVEASGIKIRVLDPTHTQVFDMSKSDVLIQGSLNLTSPVGGESYQVGQRAEIEWRATPNIQNVKLEYSLDEFESSKIISDYVPNKGKFVWNIPNQIAEGWKIRISDASNQSVFSTSPMPFRTRGGLEMISPKGGESWPAGSKQTITWSTLGVIPKIRLEYSSDNFQTSLPIATNADNTGSYTWTIPAIPHSEIKLRVEAGDAPSVYSISQGSVSVSAKLELKIPSAGERWVAGEERIIRWQTTGYMPLVDLEYSKDDFNKDIHLIAAKVPNVESYTWHVPNDPSAQARIRIRSSENNNVASVSEEPFQIDFYHVRWMVRDQETNDFLSGLTMTDSAGKTVSQVGSPANFEYPYGIYTTVWTKPGYAEHRSTWLADRDRSFEIVMEMQKEKIELVRAGFDYDRNKDFMKITSWYEKDGKTNSAVIQSEIKIFKDNEPVKSLVSTTPDAQGYFHMMWDTATVEGNSKYFASVAVTTASGKIYTSPISYQLDIPVKERKEPVTHHAITSMYLHPLGNAPQPILPKEPEPEAKPLERPKAEEPVKPAKVEPSQPIESSTSSVGAPELEAILNKNLPNTVKTEEDEKEETRLKELSTAVRTPLKETQLIAPHEAVMQETVSITYMTTPGAHPVLDLYDANRKLAISAKPMEPGDIPGTFTCLIPVRGLNFIPGKSVRVSVIELGTGRFKAAEIMILSASAALGYTKEMGDRSVLEVLQKLDSVLELLQQVRNEKTDLADAIKTMGFEIENLSSSLTASVIDDRVLEKINDVAENLAEIAHKKGYDGSFLTAQALRSKSDITFVNRKVKDIQSLIQSLEKLYYYSQASKS